MSEVQLTIDGQEVIVAAYSTILQAARQIGIQIPTLCYYHLEETAMKNQVASCRICVVEVEGRRNLAPACATPVTEGMVVKTNTLRVLEARKTILSLLLSDHPQDCLACTKAGNCELQDMAQRLGMRKQAVSKEKAQSSYPLDVGLVIVRDMDKCIRCRRCETVCREIQSVGALSGVRRGFESVVMPAFENPLAKTNCVQCGQCVVVCPTGALTEREAIDDVLNVLNHIQKKVIVQVAPAVRVALGEALGLPAGTDVSGKMVTALKRLGFDYVFDTNFAADVTIMEEAYELIERLTAFLEAGETQQLPILTSCCPAWVNFFESNYKELLHLPSTVRSPQQIFGAVAKTYLAQKMNLPLKQTVVVSVMPCLAKKGEAKREELGDDVDLVLSTRELARMIIAANIDFNSLEASEFDTPLGTATGAAAIFGTTGGVMEAACRTAYEKVTGKVLEKVNFEALRGFEGIRMATINLEGKTLNVAIAHGLKNARVIMEELKQGNPRKLHAIEVMACPGGCIGGAGQPNHHGDITILKKRQALLYTEDSQNVLRKSHENPEVLAMYEAYFKTPLSHKAHKHLHTYYIPQNKF